MNHINPVIKIKDNLNNLFISKKDKKHVNTIDTKANILTGVS